MLPLIFRVFPVGCEKLVVIPSVLAFSFFAIFPGYQSFSQLPLPPALLPWAVHFVEFGFSNHLPFSQPEIFSKNFPSDNLCFFAVTRTDADGQGAFSFPRSRFPSIR